MIKVQVQSDPKDNALDIIRTAVSAEIKKLEIGLIKTEKRLEIFEKKYHVSSEEFQKSFTAENMENGDREYVEWDGELKIREKITEDLKKLKGIEYVAL